MYAISTETSDAYLYVGDTMTDAVREWEADWCCKAGKVYDITKTDWKGGRKRNGKNN